MEIAYILALAVALGMDAMSVCMAIGVKWHGPKQKLRLAWHMGLFQFLMPIIGWAVGRQFAEALRDIGIYIAAGLVFAVAIKMLVEALKSHPGAVAEEVEHEAEIILHAHPKDPTKGWPLWGLAIATSIDALVVGFSLAMSKQNIWLASIIIGITAGGMALLGVVLGKRIGQFLGKPAEILGAIILIALGVSFLCL